MKRICLSLLLIIAFVSLLMSSCANSDIKTQLPEPAPQPLVTILGNSYYVSPNGNDTNPGSLLQPFKTIQRACNILMPGDTLNIMAGKYTEKLNLKASGTKEAAIIIQNYQNDKVILDGTNAGSASNMIYIMNKNYIRIKGLEICNNSSGDTPTGIMIEGYGSGIEIINNTIHNIRSSDNAHAIAAYGSNGTTSINGLIIEGNTVYNCKLGSSESVVVNGNVTNFKILNNVIHDNDNIGIDCIGFERTAPSNDQARSGIVSGNTVYNISSANNPAYGGDACADGIYVDGGRDIIIEKNYVNNCDIGIEVAAERYNKSTTNVKVRDNLIYNCDIYGIAFGGASSRNGYATNCKFLNNTLYNNATGICIQKSQNNIVSNNIIYGGETLREGRIRTNLFSYNLWYSPNGNPQGLTPFKDPKFVDATNLNFRLNSDSPAIDAGDPNFVPDTNETDLDGNPRVLNNRVNCGAYE